MARLDPNGASTVLVDKPINGAPAMSAATHDLQLTCNGSTLTSRIDGVVAASVEDATYASGQTFLVVGANAYGAASVDGRFSNLVLTQP